MHFKYAFKTNAFLTVVYNMHMYTEPTTPLNKIFNFYQIQP